MLQVFLIRIDTKNASIIILPHVTTNENLCVRVAHYRQQSSS